MGSWDWHQLKGLRNGAVGWGTLPLLVAYPVLWIALFTVSADQWFFPAALRIAALWLVPRRQWAWLAAAEWAGIAALTPLSGVHERPLAQLLGVFVPWLVYAGVTALVVRRYEAVEPKGLSSTLAGVLASGFLAAAVNGAVLAGLQVVDGVPASSFATLLMAYGLGDYAGIVALTPILLLTHEQTWDRRGVAAFWARGRVLAPLAGLALVTFLGVARPGEPYWVAVTIPLIWLGALHGRHATIGAIALFSIGLLLLGWGEVQAWPLEQVQRVLAAAGTAALLLCARTDAMREQQLALTWTVQALEEQGQALRSATDRLATQQEEDSRRIGAELHDQVGQDMTALAVRLRLAERRACSDEMVRELRLMQDMLAAAHAHLGEVINHVHPIVLDRFGLARTLEDGPIRQMVEGAGMTYRCAVEGDPDRLPAPVATAVYRICQEAATNAVRHGGHGELMIRLAIEPDATVPRLVLEIGDDAGDIGAAMRPAGRGLQSIRDRADALGAHYAFNTGSGRPRHRLQLGATGAVLQRIARPGGGVPALQLPETRPDTQPKSRRTG